MNGKGTSHSLERCSDYQRVHVKIGVAKASLGFWQWTENQILNLCLTETSFSDTVLCMSFHYKSAQKL